MVVLRGNEEIVDACIASGAFLILIFLYVCLSNAKRIGSCCKGICQFLCCCCCRRQERVQSYDDLEELLFDVESNAGGRLDEDGNEITVGTFFSNVLDQKPKRPIPRQESEQGSRFSEPLL